ncbi:hypothetical protein NCAS_0A00410 [Naumovozyma castellii]|uniref:Uncharacterized protein n=1 Tax=Naumovozyma castellii TaxID=27288 RepID=G0V565_NAUCA|nr:hypothetical protein NCAS_0A00410 [Naumovozyma castellii CBS 4309]CCC66601.1 hypothetical protein NCAS_0A00410 [Naumovozyma castellii CBS 4309]
MMQSKSTTSSIFEVIVLHQPPNPLLKELGQKYCKFKPNMDLDTFRSPLPWVWGRANKWLYFSFFPNENQRGNIISDYYSGITFLFKKTRLFVINFRDDPKINRRIITNGKMLGDPCDVILLVLESLFEDMTSRVVDLKNKYDNDIKTVDQKRAVEAELDIIVEQLRGMEKTLEKLESTLTKYMEDTQCFTERFGRESKKFQELKKDVEEYTKGNEELEAFLLLFVQQLGSVSTLIALLRATGVTKWIQFAFSILTMTIIFPINLKNGFTKGYFFELSRNARRWISIIWHAFIVRWERFGDAVADLWANTS